MIYGVVPSELVATQIAGAIWSSRYEIPGERDGIQRPCGYKARLIDSSYWHVEGLYPDFDNPRRMGGGPELKIKADSGTVFDMYISL